MRWIFAIKQAWLERHKLKLFLVDPGKRIHSLEEITLERLDAANIAILVLDFDGVLNAYDTNQPLPEAELWLTKISQEIGEHRLAILTNKPKEARIRYFAEKFPSLFMLHGHGMKKKPHPEGLLMIAQYRGVAPHRLALVDDRLLTGILATCLAYTQGWYFYPPKTNYWRNPVRESFFSLLRVFERAFIKLIG